MQEVAHFLQVQAFKVANDQKDTFARSAYNRYYYATFLSTRDLIRELFPERHSELAHADYPKFLRGTINGEFTSEIQRARRSEDRDLLQLLAKAKSATLSLAQHIEEANAVRVLSDYHPEEAVEFEGSDRFLLGSANITDAHNWLSKTTRYVDIISRAWKQTHA